MNRVLLPFLLLLGSLIVSGQITVVPPNGSGNGAQTPNTIPATFVNNGNALVGTASSCSYVATQVTIKQVTLIADQSGSVTVDVKTVSYASYTGPASASSITASATPALSSATKYKDTTLTGWTVIIPADTVVCLALSAPATVTRVYAQLLVQ